MQCFKCKTAVAIVASREGAKKSYCVECLVDLVTRSIRDCFFRNCRVPPSPVPVILAVSGGFSSMAMMEALGILRVQNEQRGGAGKILFNFHVLHMSEMEPSSGEMADLGAAKQIVQLAATTVDVTQFEKSSKKKLQKEAKKQQKREEAAALATTGADRSAEVPPKQQTDETAEAAAASPSLYYPDHIHIKSMRKYCKYPYWNDEAISGTLPLSTKEDIYFHARRNAILTAASEIAVSCGGSDVSDAYVLFGDHAVSCAVTALDCTVRGRGANIVDLCGYSGHLHWRSEAAGGGVDTTTTKLVKPYLHVRRPMRDLLPKELIQYCRVQKIPWSGSILTFNNNNNSAVTTTGGGGGTASSSSSTLPVLLLSPSPLAQVPSGKSLYRTLEQFVLAMCEGGTYRSTVFNILNAVEKLATAYTEELGNIAATKQRSEIQQKRFGPKNAAAFGSASSSSKEDGIPAVAYGLSSSDLMGSLSACLLCGGGHSITTTNQTALSFCRGCAHSLKRIGGENNVISSTTIQFVSELSEHVVGAGGLKKMTEDEMRYELAEFLL